MREWIDRDLEVLYALAGLAQRYWQESRRLRPVEVVNEYEKTILDELDLLREAANAAQLKRNFAGSHLLYVPEVYWDYCRVNVIVMERIHGVPISDMERLRAAGHGPEEACRERRADLLHAGLPPQLLSRRHASGKHLRAHRRSAEPRYAAVDFGIVGTLDPQDQQYLARNFLAVFERDYRRVATLHLESGWVPPDTRIDEMESAVRTVCEPIFDRPLKDISFGTILLRLFEISRRFDMTVQPQLVLLQKTLLNVEGLGRQLYPELDIWRTASPILREWMRERSSPRRLWRNLRAQLPELIELARVLPGLVKGALERVREGKMRVHLDASSLERLAAWLDTHYRPR